MMHPTDHMSIAAVYESVFSRSSGGRYLHAYHDHYDLVTLQQFTKEASATESAAWGNDIEDAFIVGPLPTMWKKIKD
jgi:hypothetical protein